MGEFNLFLIIVGAIINFTGWGLYRLSLKVSGVVVGIIIGVLVSIPVGLDVRDYVVERRKKQKE